MTKRVVILQPYVPGYRVAFFERLQQTLAQDGVECVIAAGIPQGDQAERGDAVRPEWLVPVKHRTVSISGRSIDLSVRPVPWQGADAIILGLEGSSLPVYHALLKAQASKVRVGLWGHVRSYVAPANSMDLWLETRQMRLSDHVFAYTPGGAADAVRRGVPEFKVTTVMNTVDTSELSHELDAIDEAHINRHAQAHGFNAERSLCFIGGLDSSKRVQFLAQALDELWYLDQSVKLLIGGRGPERYLLDQAVKRGQAISFGYLRNQEKALMLKSTRGICMPGRIGLVAVDGLIANRPVLTTDWAYHAPEAEYLVEGISRFTSRDDAQDYAASMISFLNDAPERPTSIGEVPTIEKMTNNFSQGIRQMLS